MDSPQRSVGVLLIVWLMAVLVPSTTWSRFNGLPVDSPLELVVATIVVVALLSRSSRRSLGIGIRAIGPNGLRFALILGAVVLAAKLLMCAGNVAPGFHGCYSSPFMEAAREDSGVRECGRSYENLFNRGGATRFDSSIDFGSPEAAIIDQTNWNLSYLNSLRFNTYRPGQTDRYRPPLRIRWSGEIETSRDRRIAVEYIGEGRVAVEERSIQLPPSYVQPARVFLPLHQGQTDLAIDFSFDDGSLIGEEDVPRGPFAMIRVSEFARSSGLERPLRAVGPSQATAALSVFTDLSLAAFGLVMAVALGLGIGRAGRVVALLAVVGTAAWVLNRNTFGLAPSVLPVSSEVLALLVVFVLLLYLAPDRLALVGIPACLLVTGHLVLVGADQLQTVLYRTGGDDWLTYQSFAHRILETGSLQGGEDVFYFQPGSRYLVFAGHALVGDGDLVPVVVGVLGLTGVVFLLARWLIGPMTSQATRLMVVAVGLGLLVFATSHDIVALVKVGASEYPTWILLPVVLPLLFLRDSMASAITGSAALGFCAVLRPNQTIGAVFLILLFAAVNARRLPPRVATCVLVFGGIALLPAVHNVYYGGELVLTPTGAGTVYDLPVRDLPRVFTDGATREILREKVAGMLYLTDRFPRDPVLGLALLTLQATWVIALVRMISRRKSIPWYGWGIALWPLVIALPHVCYDLTTYYPRHIIATNVALGATAAFVETRFPPKSASVSAPVALDGGGANVGARARSRSCSAT